MKRGEDPVLQQCGKQMMGQKSFAAGSSLVLFRPFNLVNGLYTVERDNFKSGMVSPEPRITRGERAGFY